MCATRTIASPGSGTPHLRRRPYAHSVTTERCMPWLSGPKRSRRPTTTRAVALAEDGFMRGDVQRLRETSQQIRDEVLERGFDPELGAFRQSYERGVLDASNLLFRYLSFYPLTMRGFSRLSTQLLQGSPKTASCIAIEQVTAWPAVREPLGCVIFGWSMR